MSGKHGLTEIPPSYWHCCGHWITPDDARCDKCGKPRLVALAAIDKPPPALGKPVWQCEDCGDCFPDALDACPNCHKPRQPAPVAVPGGSGQKGGQAATAPAERPPRASVRFVVPGHPQGKGRARSTASGHHYTPQQTRDYERSVKCAYGTATGYNREPWPAGVPLRLDVQAYFALPKSATKAEWARCEQGDMPFIGVPDGDNVLKIVKDALNTKRAKSIVGAWHDDRQVSDERCRRWRTTGEERIEVRIEEA